mgnify:CR=1 FL=1|jgi:archaellum component FlaC|tara:strand:+ start:456 stop:644 length:189 start_codon:yes stop_codon:yes gene_type:complete
MTLQEERLQAIERRIAGLEESVENVQEKISLEIKFRTKQTCTITDCIQQVIESVRELKELES